MTVPEALEQAAGLSQWINSSVHGLEISSAARQVLAGALFDQVIEHHQAMQLLIKHSLTGSAFTLHRSTFETLVRGLWLLRCASDPEIDVFQKDELKKSFITLIDEIESLPGFGAGVFSKIKKEAWAAMCSYSHGGFFPAGRRIMPDYIEPNYSAGEVLEVIRSASMMALTAAFEICEMAGRKDLLEEALNRMGSLGEVE
jgi:hypothetical protein